MNTFNKKNIGRAVSATIVVIFLIFLFQSYEQKSWLYHWLNNRLIVPHRETYTELYFTDAALLPHVISEGDNVTLQFTIHNLEGQPIDYPYLVLIEQSGKPPIQLTSGMTSMQDGESKTITVKLLFAHSPGDANIVVMLPKSEKEIRFHVNN